MASTPAPYPVLRCGRVLIAIVPVASQRRFFGSTPTVLCEATAWHEDQPDRPTEPLVLSTPFDPSIPGPPLTHPGNAERVVSTALTLWVYHPRVRARSGWTPQLSDLDMTDRGDPVSNPDLPPFAVVRGTGD